MSDTDNVMLSDSSYPNITLCIEDSRPSIRLENKEGVSKDISTSSITIDDILLKVAKALRLDSDIDGIWEMIRSGDESYLEFSSLEGLDTEKGLDLETTLNDALKQVEMDIDKEVSKDVSDALFSFHNADVLTSTLEEVYNLLIMFTLVTAADMGITNIKLADDRKETRLIEKMSKELAALDITLIVV
jgi:hypothetical protein